MDLTPFKNCLAHKHSLYISNEHKPYMPCCWFKPGVTASSYKEYQTKLSEIDITTGCRHCIEQESAGVQWSHRMLFKDPKELVIGVCFDNICNIKCITCSPYHSSQHINEWEKLDKFKNDAELKKYFVRIMEQGPSKLALIEDTIANSEFDKIRLEIFGGEPLINPVVIKFISWLVEKNYAPVTKLVITTNGTTSIQVIENSLEKFKQVTIQFSVDGITDTFELLRSGAVFDTMVNNVNYYRTLVKANPKYEYGFNFTLSWLNVTEFETFYHWLTANYQDVNSLHLTKLDGPLHYSIEMLPDDVRLQIVNNVKLDIPDSIQEFYPRSQFERLRDLFLDSVKFSSRDTTDHAVRLKNKALFENGKRAIEQLVKLRNCDIASLDKIYSMVDNSYRLNPD
jgi:hypothetical protein